MPFSQQFRALLKLAGLWALAWAVLGGVVAVVRWFSSSDVPSTGNTLGGWVINNAVAYGALGAISGLYLGLLLAQLERGRRAEGISTRRIALWGILGGAAPAVLFTALGLLFGAPAAAYMPLLGLGILSAAGSGILATSAHAAVTRERLVNAHGAHRLPPR